MPFQGGSFIPASPVVLSGQTLDAGVSVGHFVYYHVGDSMWKKAGLGTPMGTGVVYGSAEVALFGKVIGISGLTAGKFVYASETAGELSQDAESNIKIGYAVSASELLVDIKAEGDEIGAISPKAGYFGGGDTGAVSAIIDKLIFASDTTAALTATLSVARAGAGACNSRTDGYFAGGNDGAGTTVADKLIFAVDTCTAQATANLSVAREYLGACNSPYYGYFAGGNTGAVSLITDRLDFASDTTAALATANLTQARHGLAGCSSVTSKNSLIAANRIAFVNSNPDTITDSGNDFIKAGFRPGMVIKVSGSGAGNDGLYTIDSAASDVTAGTITLVAGDTLNVEAAGANVITIEYPNITIMPKHGYFAGGYVADEVATTDKLLFATETMATQDSRLDLTEDKSFIAACNSPYYGYFAGGYEDVAGAVTNKIDRLIFATDTTAVLAAIVINPARYGLAGCNSQTDGYFGGGDNGAVSLVVDKLSFATETVSQPATAELSVARSSLAACQSGGL